MKDAPEVSWHVKFDSQNLKHSGDLARWSPIAHRPSPMKVRLNPNITSLRSELHHRIIACAHAHPIKVGVVAMWLTIINSENCEHYYLMQEAVFA